MAGTRQRSAARCRRATRRLALLILSSNHWPTLRRVAARIATAVDFVQTGQIAKVDVATLQPFGAGRVIVIVTHEEASGTLRSCGLLPVKPTSRELTTSQSTTGLSLPICIWRDLACGSTAVRRTAPSPRNPAHAARWSGLAPAGRRSSSEPALRLKERICDRESSRPGVLCARFVDGGPGREARIS